MSKLFKTTTPTGKPKIVDNNNFSVASSTDGSKENHELLERLVLSYNILILYNIEDLKNMVRFVPDGYYKNK